MMKRSLNETLWSNRGVQGAGQPSRRSFLKTLGAAAVAASVPFYIRASDGSQCRRPVVGSGEHQYEMIHDWAKLPADYVWGNTHAVAEDSQGRIYIKHTVGKGSRCEDAVVVFDAEGNFITSWGKEFKGGAHGLQLVREGRDEFFLLSDPSRHLVVKTTLSGREVFRITFPEASDFYRGAGEFRPTNVAVAPDGEIFVADGYGKNYVHIYDRSGHYRKSFGGMGKDAGQLSCPHGIMVDTRGIGPRLAVADRGNRRLQYFTLEGEHLGFVKDDLRAPCHFDQRGDVLLIPDLESRVTLFDANNRLIAHLGDGGHYNGIRDKSRDKFTAGKFVAPHGASFDHAGNIFVVEWVEVGRVTKLRKLA
jgi:DNA-binding beta-propeller fold protein YncE